MRLVPLIFWSCKHLRSQLKWSQRIAGRWCLDPCFSFVFRDPFQFVDAFTSIESLDTAIG